MIWGELKNLTKVVEKQQLQIKRLDDHKISSLKIILDNKIKIDQLNQKQTSSLKLIEIQRKELDNLKQNPVPIGFIYVQLSGQSEPHTLWPQTKWNNIGPKYAGLFFRAEGGEADNFGKTQDELTRSLVISRGECFMFAKGCYQSNLADIPIMVSFDSDKAFYTGTNGNVKLGLNFMYTIHENRPRNQAIRIWIRIK